MAKHTTATNQRLVSLSRFMQILDGTFPSGIFVHSFGLEPHIIKWIVKDITTLRVYLNNLILDQYMRLEFVIVKKIYEDLKNEKMNKIYSLDNSYSSFLSYEYTKASTNIGFNYYTQLKSQVSKTVVKKYFDALETKKCDGNEIIVLATYAFDLDIDFEDFIDQANSSIKSLAWNDENVTAHHGIIPTAQKVNIKDLSKDELNVYTLIARKFVAQFYEPKEYIHTQIEVDINNNIFTTSSKRTTKQGFEVLFKGEIEDDETERS